MPSGGTRRKGDESANWVWWSVIPFGLGAWAPIYAGARVHNRRWLAFGALWSLITVAGWVVAIASNGGAAGGLLIHLGWAGAIARNAWPTAHEPGGNAPAQVIARLPGIDDALAKQIVRARNDTHGFTSVEDLGAALDLDGNLVEGLRDCVVFLPRSQ